MSCNGLCMAHWNSTWYKALADPRYFWQRQVKGTGRFKTNDGGGNRPNFPRRVRSFLAGIPYRTTTTCARSRETISREIGNGLNPLRSHIITKWSTIVRVNVVLSVVPRRTVKVTLTGARRSTTWAEIIIRVRSDLCDVNRWYWRDWSKKLWCCWSTVR